MKKVSAWINEYFAFSQTEVRGMVVLLLFTLGVIGLSAFFTGRSATTPIPDRDWKTLEALVAQLDSNQVASSAPVEKSLVLHSFNPNTADSATLTQLGLSPWIARRVLRYRAKGGVFRVKSDFKKMYGLPEATYERLYEYIQLPEKKRRTTASRAAKDRADRTDKPKSSYAKRTDTDYRRAPLDINVADTSSLKRLPGIGTTLSARIVKYRQLLGGFHRLEQLQEVYNMSEHGAASLRTEAYIAEGNQVTRLNINLLDAKTLAQHPYISWEVARAVVNHRRDYGNYQALEDLREVYLIDEELFAKLTPYLEI
ncbi:MAG: helix-hairpin-helix domain-containing protein [Tunicatimonas sp.]